MAKIGASVGTGGDNRPDDVKAVQTLLNLNIARLAPLPPLDVDGECDAATVQAITEFQRKVLGAAQPDGRVDPDGRTLAKLSEAGPRTITLTGLPLPGPAEKVLTEILSAAGLVTAQVTSVTRTPAEQARVMYENCKALGVAHNKTLYGPAGDQVVQAYADNESKPRDAVIALMLAKIHEVGPARVSMHISESHYVFDVAPSSIPEASRPKFVNAIHAHAAVSKLIAPPVDPAYHLEIPKSALG
jgi:hypothetical protein